MASQKQHGDSAALSATMLREHVVEVDKLDVDGHAAGLCGLGRALAVSSYSSKAKVAGLELLRACIQRWPGREGAEVTNPDASHKILVDVVVRSTTNTATVVRMANWCLGTLCRYLQCYLFYC